MAGVARCFARGRCSRGRPAPDHGAERSGAECSGSGDFGGRVGGVCRRRTEKNYFEHPEKWIGADARPGVFIDDRFVTAGALANTGFSILIYAKLKFGHYFSVSILSIQTRANSGNGHTRGFCFPHPAGNRPPIPLPAVLHRSGKRIGQRAELSAMLS